MLRFCRCSTKRFTEPQRPGRSLSSCASKLSRNTGSSDKCSPQNALNLKPNQHPKHPNPETHRNTQDAHPNAETICMPASCIRGCRKAAPVRRQGPRRDSKTPNPKPSTLIDTSLGRCLPVVHNVVATSTCCGAAQANPAV